MPPAPSPAAGPEEVESPAAGPEEGQPPGGETPSTSPAPTDPQPTPSAESPRKKKQPFSDLESQPDASTPRSDWRQAPPQPQARQPAQHEQPQPQPDPDTPTRKPGRGLVIGGAVLTGLGVGGLGAMGAGMALGQKAEDDFESDPFERADADSQGRTANILAVFGGVGGGVLIATGVALLAVGKRKQKNLAFAPVLGPDGAGLGLRASF
jgi:hypothetical protein